MMLDTLKTMLAAYGPTGREGLVAEEVKKLLQGKVDSMETDVMGNLICVKKGQEGGKTIMFSAHMDHIGLVVTDIEETQNTVASFKDCPQNHWAYKYVEELRSDNIISGYADGNFYPDNKVKREEFIKMIVVLSGITSQDVSCDFDDVSAFAWYRPFVASAFDAGIVKGVDDRNFGVGSDISRQDVAVIICRLLDKLGTDINAKSDKTFADEQDISDYASESVDTLSALSVLNGYEDGTFRPKASLTRAEASKIICLVKALIK